jgi:hypothetical protein
VLRQVDLITDIAMGSIEHVVTGPYDGWRRRSDGAATIASFAAMWPW